MTTQRLYGEDNDHGRWVRRQRSLDSHQHCFTLNDADWIHHRYDLPVPGKRKRSLQLMMHVEVKTHGSFPRESQAETLFFLHQVCRKAVVVKRLGGREQITLWHFGVFLLRFSGTCADNSREGIWWGAFNNDRKDGFIDWTTIESQEALIDILGLNVNPNTFEPMKASGRCHHLEQEIILSVDGPFGPFEERIKVRS